MYSRYHHRQTVDSRDQKCIPPNLKLTKLHQQLEHYLQKVSSRMKSMDSQVRIDSKLAAFKNRGNHKDLLEFQ